MRNLADRASFRDPAGQIVDRDGVLRRTIASPFEGSFRTVSESGLFEKLWSDELLVRHEMRRNSDGELEVLPERIPFISYSHEWSPAQLRDAALVTLDAARLALARGLTMRDASANNVQFLRGRPILIDTLSFEPHERGKPWLAYGQFLRIPVNPATCSGPIRPGVPVQSGHTDRARSALVVAV